MSLFDDENARNALTRSASAQLSSWCTVVEECHKSRTPNLVGNDVRLRESNSIGSKNSRIRTMTSMCGSGKSHAVMNAGGYYRPSPYTYQVSFTFIPLF